MASEAETALRGKLAEIFKTVPCQPIMVRLAWHDAGTYNASDKTGGANGSIRFEPEIAHGANAGLQWALDQLEPLKKDFPDVSYADLFQLASVVAIETAGGPKIPFRMGRKDAAEGDCTEDGRLPDATKKMDHLRDVFYRMGLTDKEIVVLSGAHCLGRAHKDRSGFEGPWTKEPLVFDNAYFTEILKEDPDKDLLRLVTDMCLLDQAETKTLCEAYAKDKELFFADYTEAHKKLSELGAF
eukprot:CAMPEP_0198330848 /NCGR_PEP_ID=MMETSP1450-20131203/17199_1 /TAXON_ID=753684 ORGANISM="Madagascaria erythrocladiodes, Strain CCMP3234" /NCGR_SAMPLE_ID=MMETSP1450 /ASSEMBLY_ACC=CAM_ASM_001115 /LENGTH=240 /DNA_ID=CAMNT_0044035179 /DNA_START=105 /DNA_END=827 /DNA_ORIENTATION=+